MAEILRKLIVSKKILIHSLVFSPDGVSTAYLYNDIALKFKEVGYEVVVLTTTPHYNLMEEQLVDQPMKWKFWGWYKVSDFQGIKVIHVPQKKFKNTFLRLLGFVYWHISSFILGLLQRNVDVILSPSPPLTIGVINLWIAKLKGCKVVYNVQEIYPDILKMRNGFVLSFLKRIERYVYNKSSAVVTIDRVFYNSIVNRFVDKTKLHIIPNFVDTELYKPNVSTAVLDSNLFPYADSLKLLYAGNIGYAQSWEPLISLALKTQEDKIDYFVVGEGVSFSYLVEKVAEYGLKNIHLLPYQNRSLMPNVLAYSDLQFIFMNPKSEMQGFPSKVYTILACAKPLLVCSGKGTPIVDFLQKCACAKIVTEKVYDEKIDEMASWLRQVSKEELRKLGENGRKFIDHSYTKEIVTAQYVTMVQDLLT